MNEQYRVSDYIADFLAEQKIAHTFFLPGGGAMYLVDAIGKHPRLTSVACLHEQACTIAAEAYSRISENIGVALVTTGPGATNAITGVVGAWIESVPMLVLSGQVKRSDMIGSSGLRQRGVQEVDIVSIVKPITKYAVTVKAPEEIRIELEKALYLARSGRQGPVWIDVPVDVQCAPISKSALQPWTRQPSITPSASAESVLSENIALLKAALNKSKRPLFIAGHGIRLSGAALQFRDLVESLNIPTVTTWNALDLLPYESPLLVGRPGVVALRAPNLAVQNCDLLISIGSRLDNIITAYNPKGFARSAQRFVIDIDSNELEKHRGNFEHLIQADAKTFIEALSLACKGTQNPTWTEWTKTCADWKQRYSHKNESPSATTAGSINHYQGVEAISDAIPANTLVSTGSSGLAIEVFYTLFRNKTGQRVFLTSGLGSMGFGLPAAIGACFANYKKPMVAIESDGSLQLNIQELATIRSNNLPICLIVLNNQGYASIRNTQRNYFSGRYVGTGPEAGLWLPDLKNIAQTYEIPYRAITAGSELNSLSELIKSSMTQATPIIIDMHLQPNEILFPKVSALPQSDGSMLSMPLEDMSPLLPLSELRKEMKIPLLLASEKAERK